MKGLKYKPLILCSLCIFILLFPLVSLSETSPKEDETSGTGPIDIKSNSLEMNNKLKIVTFKGDVNAKKDSFVINCDNMIVYYKSAPGEPEKDDESKTSIDKIVATGHVTINRAKGGTATAEKAIYYQENEKMVLMGNPTVKQGSDLVKGDRITIFLNEDRSIVEGSEDSKVSVTISPRHPKR